MKTTITTLVFALFCLTALQAQETTLEKFKKSYKNTNSKNKVLTYAYVLDSDTTGTSVRHTPGGKVIRKIYSDCMVNIIEAWNGWFRVPPEMWHPEEDEIHLKADNCWVHGSVLVIGTRNYDGETLKYYTKADKKSEVVFTLKTEERLSLVSVISVLVQVKYTSSNGKIFTGWIEDEWLCGNSVTNCS